MTDDMDSAMAALDMEHYDNEDGEDGGVRGVFGNTNPGMAYYGADEEDPYIQLSAVKDVDSEAEDLEIRGDDFVLLAARNEDDVSHLEVWHRLHHNFHCPPPPPPSPPSMGPPDGSSWQILCWMANDCNLAQVL